MLGSINKSRVGSYDVFCTAFISCTACGSRNTVAFQLASFSLSDTIASSDLDAACYRAAEKKKTWDPEGKELHWKQQTQIPQYEPEASGSAIQEDETKRV